jgi:hypothetical protein
MLMKRIAEQNIKTKLNILFSRLKLSKEDIEQKELESPEELYESLKVYSQYCLDNTTDIEFELFLKELLEACKNRDKDKIILLRGEEC